MSGIDCEQIAGIEAQVEILLASVRDVASQASARDDEGTGLDTVWTNALTWAKATYYARRVREEVFGSDMFADARWDILLDLFLAQLLGKRVQVSSACIASAVPPTTALRHIQEMCESGVLDRQQCPDDNRRCYLSLSPQSFEKMEHLYHRLRNSVYKPQRTARVLS
jgi:hypothetical protein